MSTVLLAQKFSPNVKKAILYITGKILETFPALLKINQSTLEREGKTLVGGNDCLGQF